MLNCLELAPKTNHQGIKKIYSQYYIWRLQKKRHTKYLNYPTVSKIKSDGVNSHIHDQSLKKEMYRLCQGYTMQNRLSGDNINIALKLYRAILSKYMYTSLELAVRSRAYFAHPRAKFGTNNLI